MTMTTRATPTPAAIITRPPADSEPEALATGVGANVGDATVVGTAVVGAAVGVAVPVIALAVVALALTVASEASV
jgi:hypothetical protein